MTTHVFVVNSNTFKIHLEYLFAGTGAKNYKIDFNNCFKSSLSPTLERILVGMTADACRIRKNDKIIFYLQQDTTRHDEYNLAEGKFFGVFKAKTDWSFIDNNDTRQYLKNKLMKSLTFRISIEPDNVYPRGVTEWEALDEIKNILHPHQMLWSMIYRKLRGNRGNTMITLYESERLIQLLRDKNQRQSLTVSKPLTFDKDKQLICYSNETKSYNGIRKDEINIFPRMLQKYSSKQLFEIHLQSYVIKNIGKKINHSLDTCFLNAGTKLNWIGNEVGCGVGMQAIDVLIDKTQNGQRVVVPIELKVVELPNSISNQMKRYVDWLTQYYKTNLNCDIAPAIICKKHSYKKENEFKQNCKKLEAFNIEYSTICDSIKLIEFEIVGEKILFSIVDYCE